MTNQRVSIEEYVQQTVSQAPPLTAESREEIRALRQSVATFTPAVPSVVESGTHIHGGIHLMTGINHHKARVAALSRSRAADDLELLDARRDLAAARLAGYITKTVAAAPPFTEDQRRALIAIINKSR